MAFQVSGPRISAEKRLTDTTEIFFKQNTKVDLEPPVKEKQPEIKHITDAAVAIYAEIFGFTKGHISEDRITNELKDVVSYAYMVMRKEEDRETEERRKIPKPTGWQMMLIDQPIVIRKILGGYTKYLDPDPDNYSLRKKENRLLRVTLGMKEDAPAGEVYKAILKKIKS